MARGFSKQVKPGENRIEVLVFNTLANHYVTIPTRYRGDLTSGLLGPVTLSCAAVSQREMKPTPSPARPGSFSSRLAPLLEGPKAGSFMRYFLRLTLSFLKR